MMKRLYFIINPLAKNGHSLKVWKSVKQELDKSHIPYTEYFTEYRGHATSLATSIKKIESQEKKVIIVIGGDGTVHEVINGVVGAKNIHIGLIPGGSGNDFMRGYKIPKDPIAAYHFNLRQLDELPLLVDIGEVIDKKNRRSSFINNMGAGFDALITMEVNGSRLKQIFNKVSLGNLVYAYFVIKKLFSFKRTDVTVTVDGKSHQFKDTWFVTVSNQPYYGGGMKISPQASALDGQLNITIVHQLSRLKFLFVFITVFWGGHVRFKEVKNLMGKEISIHSIDSLFVHADGENIGETPIHVRTVPQVLPLLTREIE